MKKEYPICTLDLDKPEGKALNNNIKSLISILVVVNENSGIDLKILVDHNNALQALGQFLKESIASEPDFLNGRSINSLNICTTEYISEPSTVHNRFTPRENEVMALVAEGESCKEIAGHFNLKTETIRTHEKRVFGKVNSKNRIRALRKYNKLKGEVFIADADVSTLLNKIGLKE